MVEASGNTIHEHGLSRRGFGILAGLAALVTAGGVWAVGRRWSNPSTTSPAEGLGGTKPNFVVKPGSPVSEQVRSNPALLAAIAAALDLKGSDALGTAATYAEENPVPGRSQLQESWSGKWDRMLDPRLKRSVEITVANRFVSNGDTQIDLGEIKRKGLDTPESAKIGDDVWYNPLLQSVAAVGSGSIVDVSIRDSLLNPWSGEFQTNPHTTALERQETVLLAEAVLGVQLDG